ncbi:MAG: hypothetical protein KAS90_06605 [Candidatus Aenigmarchaeota archaeon]|nr:hypothetical protein [Candidatus Aenigmarchaeota archaeon]
MGKLYTYRLFAAEMEEVDVSIVDALTGSDPCYVELLVEIDFSRVESDLERYRDYKEERIISGRVESIPLAINYADEDMSPTIIVPPTITDSENPENGIAYRIYSLDDGATKVICSHESSLGGFRDTIKPANDNHYIWEGTVDEIIEEFEEAGFELKENLPVDEIQKFQKRYEESMEKRDWDSAHIRPCELEN